jgi:aldehyde:ferredoxin oxidoreductase
MFVSEPMVPLTLTKLGEVVQAVTGWDISDWELLKVGERGTNLARLFNVAHGFTAEDDVLPPRMFKPVPSGPTADRKIDPQELQKAISTYYAMMGWDEKGVPTQAKLYELGLEEFVPNH